MHDDASAGDALAEPLDLTPFLLRARSGLRRDVEALLQALPFGTLHVPLAESVAGASEDGVELREGLRFQPHLLTTGDDHVVCVLFSDVEALRQAADHFDWRTGEEDLEYVGLPAQVALEMALDVIDDHTVVGLLLNPMSESELFLTRRELASLCAGQALPLVGYVQRFGPEDLSGLRVVEGAEPLPERTVAALDACVRSVPGLLGWRASTTFHPERDLEPHLTLYLAVSTPAQRAVADAVFEAIADHLPPPGYVDIHFEDPPS